MMQLSCSLTLLAAITLLSTTPLLAQAPAAPKPTNMVVNGSFESAVQRDNLWDGISRDGFLAGDRASAPVLTQSGVIGETSMPISVSLGDLNGDGKLDILSIDPQGYIRVYFNSGGDSEPKFTFAEMSAPYLSRVPGNRPYLRMAQRGTLANLGAGKLDLVIGDYSGEIFLIRNAGTPNAPDFRQPTDVARVAMPTAKNPTQIWGNVFAPVMADIDKDGKVDLILGEGSYSANNIHVLLNQGTTQAPRFNEDAKHILAFGDGREQLTPALVDYNGDGHLDLLVGDRSGQIGLYLNKTGAPWKVGQNFEFVSYLTVGGSSPMTFGGICTVAAGDLNGDGLFDLVVGKTNGRIAYVRNVGTKQEPKWAAPVELKGEAVFPPNQIPSGWDFDFGLNRGNFYGQTTIVKAEESPAVAPPDGKAAVRMGYVKSPNKIIPPPYGVVRGILPGFNLQSNPTSELSASQIGLRGPPNLFILQQTGRLRFEPGKTYELSFRVKGAGATNCFARIVYRGYKRLGEDRVIRGERGSATVQRAEASEINSEDIRFSPSPNWAEVKKEFRVSFKDKNLADIKTTTSAAIQFFCEINPPRGPQDGGGEVYIDDVRITPKP